jgi:hypothetical protein
MYWNGGPNPDATFLARSNKKGVKILPLDMKLDQI